MTQKMNHTLIQKTLFLVSTKKIFFNFAMFY